MATNGRPNLLTIGDLADRTGVPPATLRSWEARHGFPVPVRQPSGHRRYVEGDVAVVLEVLRHRDSGFSLEAAVRQATAGMDSGPRSIHAELRRRHPELVPQVLSKSTLVALSHAIEDECSARAERPILFGAFQRERFLRDSHARWVELARTARAAVVFADDVEHARTGPLIGVGLPEDAPLNREWVVVCDAPDLPACMAAVERPGQAAEPDDERRFDAVWTVDARAVRHASRVAAAIADRYRPDWRPVTLPELDDEPAGASADLHRASGLLNRMVGYVDAHR